MARGQCQANGHGKGKGATVSGPGHAARATDTFGPLEWQPVIYHGPWHAGETMIRTGDVFKALLLEPLMRTGVLKSEALTLSSKDLSVFQNTSGYSTSVLVDFQAILACIFAAKSTQWDMENKLWASEVTKAPTSAKVTLALRSSSFFRTACYNIGS